MRPSCCGFNADRLLEDRLIEDSESGSIAPTGKAGKEFEHEAFWSFFAKPGTRAPRLSRDRLGLPHGRGNSDGNLGVWASIIAGGTDGFANIRSAMECAPTRNHSPCFGRLPYPLGAGALRESARRTGAPERRRSAELRFGSAMQVDGRARGPDAGFNAERRDAVSMGVAARRRAHRADRQRSWNPSAHRIPGSLHNGCGTALARAGACFEGTEPCGRQAGGARSSCAE